MARETFRQTFEDSFRAGGGTLVSTRVSPGTGTSALHRPYGQESVRVFEAALPMSCKADAGVGRLRAGVMGGENGVAGRLSLPGGAGGG